MRPSPIALLGLTAAGEVVTVTRVTAELSGVWHQVTFDRWKPDAA